MNAKSLITAAVAAAFAVPLAAYADGDKASSSGGASAAASSSGGGQASAGASSGADQMFKDLDKNNDGFISREEAKGSPHEKDFDKLDKKQQQALLAAGKKAQTYFAKEAKGLDDEMVKAFKENKVEVVTLTPAEYDAWIKVAKDSSYAEFAKEVADGKKLIDEALAVK